MNHAADAGRWWRRKAPIGLIAVLCGLLSACGGGASGPVASGPSTGPPPSGPSPSPFPSHADFLHVLRGDSVETYHIDLDTGRLQFAATQEVGPAHALSGEPGGRFVYAAYGPTGKEFPYHGPDPSVVAYMADEQSGKLQTVSEATNIPITNTGSWLGGWVWLSASSDRVYALWLTTSGGGYHRNVYDYATHAVSHGQLGPAYMQDFPEYDPGHVTVDVNSNTFFKTTPDGGKGGFTAHVVEEDGQLTQSGWSNLCGPEKLGHSMRTPLVAVRGFMLASGFTEGGESKVCSWEGPRLSSRGSLHLTSNTAAAFVPVSDTAPALVAMSNETGTTPEAYSGFNEVQLFSMGPDGVLQLLDKAAGPKHVDIAQLVFHPSGRFLYVSYREWDGRGSVPSSLRAYSVSPEGRLEMIENLDDAGGYVETWLGYGWLFPDPVPPIMAVSTRAIIPRL